MRPSEPTYLMLSFADGSVGVMQLYRPAPDEAAIAAEIGRALLPPEKGPVAAWSVLPGPEAIPADRTYREAWRPGEGGITLNLDAARAIQLGRIRAARADKLAALDRDWTIAAAQKREADAEAIEAERQRLRDLPETLAPALAAARDAEELKRVWAEGLG